MVPMQSATWYRIVSYAIRGSLMCILVDGMMRKMKRPYKWDSIATNGTQLETGEEGTLDYDRGADEGDFLTRESCRKRLIS